MTTLGFRINIADTVVGNWQTSWSGLAPYFAIFGLIDAKSTQEETRASLERSLDFRQPMVWWLARFAPDCGTRDRVKTYRA
jgi:hypothetical protein